MVVVLGSGSGFCVSRGRLAVVTRLAGGSIDVSEPRARQPALAEGCAAVGRSVRRALLHGD
jgi:hypothetical protein